MAGLEATFGGEYRELTNFNEDMRNWYRALSIRRVKQERVFSAIRWDDFGFPGRDGEKSTLWIGTQGSLFCARIQKRYNENLRLKLVFLLQT